MSLTLPIEMPPERYVELVAAKEIASHVSGIDKHGVTESLYTIVTPINDDVFKVEMLFEYAGWGWISGFNCEVNYNTESKSFNDWKSEHEDDPNSSISMYNIFKIFFTGG